MTTFLPRTPLAVTALPERGPLSHPIVRDIVLILGAIAFLSAAAQVSFEVPFSTARSGELVPITGQTFGVLLVGITLGLRRGVAATIGYLALGLVGAPVYAQAASGPAILFTGSTAGYLWGFLLAAAFLGWCADRGLDRGPWLYAVLLAGNALIYAAGLPVLALWLDRHGLDVSVWQAGLWPFIPGDFAKLMGAAFAIPSAWSLVRGFRR